MLNETRESGSFFASLLNMLGSILHFLSTTIGHMLGTVLLGFLWLIAKSYKDNSTLAELWNHPEQLVSPILIAILMMSLFGLLVRHIRQRSIIRCFGIRLFSKHSTKEEKDGDWSLLRQDIQNANDSRSELWILGATGKATFSSYGSPLYDPLKNYGGAIRILLLQPESFGLAKRAQDLKQDAQSYTDEILDSIDCCKELANKHGRDVQLRLYAGVPTWKMIVTNQHLWLQHYSPKDHVEDTPMYSFEPVAGEATLYSGQKYAFFNTWNYAKVFQVNLKTWDRRNYKQLLSVQA